MKSLQLSTLILASLAMLVAADDDFAEGEYLLVIDAELVKTEEDMEDVKKTLSKDYGIETIKPLDIGDAVKMLHVNASDEAEVQRATDELAEVKDWEKNGKVELNKRDCCCQDVSAAETWGLDRIDQRNQLESTDPFNPAAKYQQSQYKGAGVVAYIGDTGIDVTHPQFEGRAINGFSIDTFDDDHGHGTHVAGTVGSRLYGVAKDVTLVSVKVFSIHQFNSWANVIAGLRWIYFDHADRQSNAGGVLPKSVVNLSLGGGINLCAEFAVNALIGAGISVVVSAGNNAFDACFFSPARVPNAVTVGATDVFDNPAGFSNWGRCVDIYGPGVDVTSTWPNRDGKNAIQGTSMAAPHVTGAVALKMGKEEDALLPHVVSFWLRWQSTKNRLNLYGNHATSPNRLVYVDCKLRSPLRLVS